MSGTAFVKGCVESGGVLAVLLWTCYPSAAAEREPTIRCQIRVTPQDDAIRLDAIATGRKPLRGQYRLEISKNSRSGSSQNVQSGAFDLQPDRDTILTTVILDGGALGHYQASLSIKSDFGSVSCVSP